MRLRPGASADGGVPRACASVVAIAEPGVAPRRGAAGVTGSLGAPSPTFATIAAAGGRT